MGPNAGCVNSAAPADAPGQWPAEWHLLNRLVFFVARVGGVNTFSTKILIS